MALATQIQIPVFRDYSRTPLRPFRRSPHLITVAKLADITVPPDILASALAGNECAQAAIYAAVAPATFGLVRRLAGSRPLAEDLFQDTMMTLFQSLSAYRGEAPIGVWVRQIAVSKYLMYLRSPWHRARMHFSTGGDCEGPWSEALLPSTPGPRAEDFDVERALESLGPTARAVDRQTCTTL